MRTLILWRSIYIHGMVSLALLLFALTCFSQRIIQVPAGALTIQAGIDAASNGDTVLVSPGTYFETVDFHGKAVTVKGIGPSQGVVIDGGLKGPVVSFRSGEQRSSVLTNLTVEHGSPANLENQLVPAAGGILIINAAPSIIGVNILNNADCGIGSYGSSPFIQGSTVSGTLHTATGAGCPNTSLSSNDPLVARGTGIYIVGQFPEGLPSVISGNDVARNANDISLSETEAPGITIVDGGNVLLSNNVVTQNIARIVGGSGISIRGHTSASITQNLVTANLEDATQPYYSTSSFSDEGAIHIFVPSDATVYLTNNTVAFNLYIPPLSMSGEYEPNLGTQLWLQNYGSVIASNNLLIGVDTFAPVECVTDPQNVSAGSLNLSHNDVYTAAGPATYDGIRCAGLTGTNGNISADPLFLNPSATNSNFQLQAASPAVDAGLNTAVGVGLTDLLGAPRIQNAKGLPTAIIDMGAYEHTGVPSLPPAPDFALTLSPTKVSSSPTTPGLVQVTLTPTSSLQAQVQLSCSNQTAAVQCSFLPSAVTLSGGVPQTVQLTLSTVQVSLTSPAATTLSGHLQDRLGAISLSFLSLSWLPLSFPSRVPRRRRALAAATGLLAGFSLLGLSGCVHLNQIPTAANVLVTAHADSGQQHSAALSLSVTR